MPTSGILFYVLEIFLLFKVLLIVIGQYEERVMERVSTHRLKAQGLLTLNLQIHNCYGWKVDTLLKEGIIPHEV